MSTKRALQAILVIGLMGMMFSGMLLYREACRQLIGGCTLGEAGAGTEGFILGYPPCLWGLVMYLVIVVLAALGLRSASRDYPVAEAR